MARVTQSAVGVAAVDVCGDQAHSQQFVNVDAEEGEEEEEEEGVRDRRR